MHVLGAAQTPGPAWKGAFLSERSFSSQRTAAAAGGHPAPEDNGTTLDGDTGPAPAPTPPRAEPGVRGREGRLGKLVGSEILAGHLGNGSLGGFKGRHNGELGTQQRPWAFRIQP